MKSNPLGHSMKIPLYTPSIMNIFVKFVGKIITFCSRSLSLFSFLLFSFKKTPKLKMIGPVLVGCIHLPIDVKIFTELSNKKCKRKFPNK